MLNLGYINAMEKKRSEMIYERAKKADRQFNRCKIEIKCKIDSDVSLELSAWAFPKEVWVNAMPGIEKDMLQK